jgi:myo-inositol-1(or 4)-monophosphatase
VPREYRELAEIALSVGREAAQILSSGHRSRPAVECKQAPVDLVTEWDRRSEAHIIERLSRLTPDIPVVAEESGGSSTSRLTWYCDPLDGTTNFVHGHPFFAVSIGAMQAGEPVAGAVVAPALNLCWLGSRGDVARRNGEACQVSHTATLGDALLATGFPPDRQRAPHSNLDAYVKAKRKVRGIRRCGSASIDLCFVADGTYDGYWERALHAWDVVAGAAMVVAAGGRVTALDGGSARLEIGHLIASNSTLHPAMLGLIGEQPMQVPTS